MKTCKRLDVFSKASASIATLSRITSIIDGPLLLISTGTGVLLSIINKKKLAKKVEGVYSRVKVVLIDFRSYLRGVDFDMN